jgi:hypothetical protein
MNWSINHHGIEGSLTAGAYVDRSDIAVPWVDEAGECEGVGPEAYIRPRRSHDGIVSPIAVVGIYREKVDVLVTLLLQVVFDCGLTRRERRPAAGFPRIAKTRNIAIWFDRVKLGRTNRTAVEIHGT